jgi:hypothetical protein
LRSELLVSDPSSNDAAVPARAPGDAAVSIAFTREELVVLSELAKLRLPLLGDRPLGGMDAGVRDVLTGSARRSLLARGVATRTEDSVLVARAAIGLLEIVAAGSLRVVCDELDGAGALLARRLWFAVPYAAVEVWVDEDENYRFLPFATVDLLPRILERTGVIDATDRAGAPIPLPYGAWVTARDAAHAGRLLEARQALADGGVEGAAGDALLATLERVQRVVGLQIVHHPSPTTTAGGEISWMDGGDAGLWLTPTLDQPFTTVDVRTDGWFGDAGEPEPSTDLGPVPVSVEPIARQAVADALLSFLPTSD